MWPLIIDILVNLFDAFLGVFFILLFCKCKFNEHRFISVITILICFSISTAYLFISTFSLLQSILIFLVLLFYSLKLRSSSFLQKFLAPIIFELVLITISTLCLMVYSYLFDYKFNDFIIEKSEIRYLSILSCKIILTFCLLVIVKVFAIKSTFRAIDLILYLFAPFMTIMVLYTFMQIGITYNINSYFTYIIFSVLGLTVVNSFSLILFIEASKNAQAKYELEIFTQQKELEQQKYSELKNIYEQIATQRHDFKKKLLGLKKLVEDGEFDALDSFINETETMLKAPIDYIHTNNRMIDYILNSKISANSNIKFIVTGTFENVNCLSELDIASILGNMVDNALEANNLNDSEIIEIDFFIKNNYQNIICKNPIKQPVLSNNPSLTTTKTDKTIHGYGIKSMKKIVESANGFIEFYEENNMFCVHIALPIEKGTESLE